MATGVAAAAAGRQPEMVVVVVRSSLMPASRRGPLRQFFLETVGEPSISWQVWFPMFRDHVIAYGQNKKPKARRIAILKSSLSVEGYRVCLSVCAGDNLSFEEVLKRLSDGFAHQVNNIFARPVFHRCAQLQGESCEQFVTALRLLMARCDYNKHFQVKLLRDRFVAGCSNGTIREKLLSLTH